MSVKNVSQCGHFMTAIQSSRHLDFHWQLFCPIKKFKTAICESCSAKKKCGKEESFQKSINCGLSSPHSVFSRPCHGLTSVSPVLPRLQSDAITWEIMGLFKPFIGLCVVDTFVYHFWCSNSIYIKYRQLCESG